MVSHAPLLMALPGTQVLQLTRHASPPPITANPPISNGGKAFIKAPNTFMAAALRDEDEGLLS